MKPASCFNTLPEGYQEVFTIDAQNKRLSRLLSIPSIIVLLVGVVAISAFNVTEDADIPFYVWFGLFYLLLLLYIVAHELTHGIVYALRTHRKLTYGIDNKIAWCGVKDTFVSRKTAIEALSAPLVVYTIVFGLAAVSLPSLLWKEVFGLLLFAHLAGCAGDLYDLYLLLFRFRNPKLLMLDTGPKQVFYLPLEES